MKKTALLLPFLFFACGSDSNDSDSDNDDQSTLTVEETKEGLKNNSIAFMEEMDSMNSCSQIDDLTATLDCMDVDSETDRKAKTKANESPLFSNFLLNTLVGLKNYQNSFDKTQISAFLLTNTMSSFLDEDSLLDEYNNEKGTWVWNNTTKEFDKTSNGGNMKFLVDCGGNSVTLEVFEFDTGYFTDTQEEVPTRLVAELKYNNEVYMTQDFSASVDDYKFLPNSLSNQTTLGCMGLNIAFQNTSNETFSASSSILMDGDTVFDMTMSANGNFYPIDNNGDDIDNSIDEILNRLNFSIKVVNAEVRASGDITNKVVPDEDSTIQEQADFLNANTEIQILLDDAIVAYGAFYVDEDTYEEYNYNTGYYETVTEEILNIHMVFNDDSTQDLEVYFDDSFNELEDKLNDILDNFETTLDDALSN